MREQVDWITQNLKIKDLTPMAKHEIDKEDLKIRSSNK